MVSAAEKLFLLHGHDDVSLRDIAWEAGFYESTLRLFFADKESLYFTVVLRGIRTLNAMYVYHTESEATGLKQLSGLGQTIYEFSRRCPDFYRPIYAESSDVCKNGNIGTVIKCVEDEAIGNELGHIELALYLIVLSIGAIHLDPCWKVALESTRVDFDRFAGDLPGFICQMKANTVADHDRGQTSPWRLKNRL